MKKKQEVSAELDLEKKNSIFEVWRQLKDSIFNVLFVLLDRASQEGESMLSIINQSGLDYLQMFAFPFNEAVISVWNGGDTLNNIMKFFNVLNLNTYMPSVGFGAYLAVVYLLIMAIIFVILDIIYVSYSFSKKKFRFTWPLVILGHIVPLFVTVLFIPITQGLFLMVNCQASQDDPQKQVMSSYNDIVCFEGWHLFHSVITLLFTFIFVFISCVVALAMFQPRMSTNKLQARQNSTAQFIFIINKIVCQFVFNFTPFDNTFIYTAMLFLLSGWLYWSYNIQDPYYNKQVSKFFRICSSYYFWTNLMLMVSQLLQQFNFNGGLVAWLGGLPFIGIIIIFQRKSNIDKLFSSDLKFRSGEQLEIHLKNVLQLIQTQQTDKNSYMLLIGYIEKHKEVCNQEDCPLKTSKRKKGTEVGDMEENCRLLIKQLDRMYQTGIRKYPRCTKLRLSYAFFHLQRTKNKNKAYEQFLHAEKTNPTFEQQFIIYRFKKIIKDNLEDEEDQENNTDLIQIIRFDNHVSLCEQAILLSSRLHKEFWTELREEIPDLKKLNRIGSKITQTVLSAKQNFTEIQKINSSVPEVMHSYAIYIICVLQDMYTGTKILENSKRLEEEREGASSQDGGLIDNDVQAFERENMALVVVSAKPEDVGRMLRANLLFTEISGFFKQQIFDRKIEKLLPEIYKVHHPSLMIDWARDQNESSKYLQVDHQAFIKQKSGFIVPITYKIVFNPIEQVFLAHFRIECSYKNYAYIICDAHGTIKQVSASAYSYFQLSKDKLEAENLHIDSIIENAIIDNGYYLNDGKEVECRFRNQVRKYLIVGQEITVRSNRSNEDGNQQNQNMLQKVNLTIGFQFRIEKFDTKELSKMRSQLRSLHYNDIERADSGIASQIMNLYKAPDMSGMEEYQNAEVQEVQFVNYGLKIKTLRLTNNQLHMIYQEDEQDDFDNNFEQSDDEEQGRGRFDDERYVQVVKKAINTNLSHIEVRVFRNVSLAFILAVFGVMFYELFLTIDLYDRMQYFTQQNYHRASECIFLNQVVAASIRDVNKTEYAQILSNHSIKFKSQNIVNCLLQDKKVVKKNIVEAIILVQARLREYFHGSSTQSSIPITYINYLTNIYPSMWRIKLPLSTDMTYMIITLIVIAVISLAMALIWIYVKLKIEKKRFDILIWFLDIPIPYVTFLCYRCDKFLKSFTGMKEGGSRNLDREDQNYFEEYVDKKDQLEEEIEEQQKARKTLVARHKKKTLLSKLDGTYFKYFTLIIYFFIFTVANKILLYTNIYAMEIVRPQYELHINWVYKNGAYQIVKSLKDKGYDFKIGSQTLDEMTERLRKTYLNMVGRNNLKASYNSFENSNGYFSSLNERVFFTSLCPDPSTDECQNLLQGSLSKGVFSYNQYIYSTSNLSTTELFIANVRYIEPITLQLIQLKKQYLMGLFSSSSNLSSIFLYIFTVLTFLFFLSFWLMYLRELNTGLNQTIQMLNMIPLKVLPNSNKETKRFIRWIIRESNKKKHEQ